MKYYLLLRMYDYVSFLIENKCNLGNKYNLYICDSIHMIYFKSLYYKALG